MASKAARTARAARTVKERWKAKAWYKIHAPGMLNFAPVSETIALEPEAVYGRITKVSLQDITQDMRHKNILVKLQVNQARGYNLYTQYLGHQLTNDYIRLLTRRRHSKVDGIFDMTTKDEVRVRIKPMVITDKRIQTSQQRAIRTLISNALNEFIPSHSLAELFHEINSGDLNRNLAKDIRVLYPTKRVEIRKLDVISAPELMEVPPDPDAEEEEDEEEEAEEAEEDQDEAEDLKKPEEGETKEADEGEKEAEVAEVTEVAEAPEGEVETVDETDAVVEAEPVAEVEEVQEAEAVEEVAEVEEIQEAEPEPPPDPDAPAAPAPEPESAATAHPAAPVEAEEVQEAEAVEEETPVKEE